jgi:hypothetical protein
MTLTLDLAGAIVVAGRRSAAERGVAASLVVVGLTQSRRLIWRLS